MKWQNQKYQLWVVNTFSESQLYLWNNWKRLFPLVDKLVSLSPAKAFIRTAQAAQHKSSLLGFGRMAWSKENNEKWTRKYRENESEKVDVLFYYTQIWAPDWHQFDKTGVPPDVFVQLYNYPSSQKTREGLIIAITRAIVEEHSAIIEPAIVDISKIVPDSIVVKTTRSWSPGSQFPNQIQDMNNWELERVLEATNKPSLADRIRSTFKGRPNNA
jgi:hypothetical protein